MVWNGGVSNCFKITLNKALSLSINLQLLAPVSLQLPISLCIHDEIPSCDALQLTITSPTYFQVGRRTFIYLFIFFFIFKCVLVDCRHGAMN